MLESCIPWHVILKSPPLDKRNVMKSPPRYVAVRNTDRGQHVWETLYMCMIHTSYTTRRLSQGSNRIMYMYNRQDSGLVRGWVGGTTQSEKAVRLFIKQSVY
jgi:hypothetical protein